jgi:hypothetical protein
MCVHTLVVIQKHTLRVHFIALASLTLVTNLCVRTTQAYRLLVFTHQPGENVGYLYVNIKLCVVCLQRLLSRVY